MKDAIDNVAVKPIRKPGETSHDVDNRESVKALGVEVVGQEILEPAQPWVQRTRPSFAQGDQCACQQANQATTNNEPSNDVSQISEK